MSIVVAPAPRARRHGSRSRSCGGRGRWWPAPPPAHCARPPRRPRSAPPGSASAAGRRVATAARRAPGRPRAPTHSSARRLPFGPAWNSSSPSTSAARRWRSACRRRRGELIDREQVRVDHDLDARVLFGTRSPTSSIGSWIGPRNGTTGGSSRSASGCGGPVGPDVRARLAAEHRGRGASSRSATRLPHSPALARLRRPRRQGAGARRGMGRRSSRARNYIAMVVCTGVGGGIVLDGRLLDGAARQRRPHRPRDRGAQRAVAARAARGLSRGRGERHRDRGDHRCARRASRRYDIMSPHRTARRPRGARRCATCSTSISPWSAAPSRSASARLLRRRAAARSTTHCRLNFVRGASHHAGCASATRARSSAPARSVARRLPVRRVGPPSRTKTASPPGLFDDDPDEATDGDDD